MMAPRSSWRRVRVERGIYLLPNGKYAVPCRRGGRQFYRMVGSDLALARSACEALIAAAEAGVAAASPRVRFDTVASWWLEHFEAKVAAGQHPFDHARHAREIREQMASSPFAALLERGSATSCGSVLPLTGAA